MKNRPNILFFFTDDQRFDTIRALGNTEVMTPNMDELVRNGTTFTHAHIPCGSTGAVCMPSRAMLHTGRTLFHLENHGSQIPEEHALLGETLIKDGYQTIGIGKWHNGPRSFARSFTDGGEIFFGGMWDHWNVPAYDFDPAGKYENTSKFIINANHSNEVITQNCNHMHIGKHSSELFCEKAINWLETNQSKDPFFMYISFMAPHDPRSMPEPYLQMYDTQKIRLPENFMPEHPFDFGLRNGRDETLAPYPRSPEIVRKHIAEYYGMISHLDNELGKVINALKNVGKYENTIIVFAGDNGLALGQHGLFGKQNNYEHSIRVPLIFSGPRIPKNERRSSYVYLLDVFPTLCELVGICIPDTVEGTSLVPAIQGKKRTIRETIYFAYADLIRSVKDERFKLIEYRTDRVRKTQLFDLDNDPNEMKDLYGDPQFEEVIQNLRKELLRYKSEWESNHHPTSEAYWARY